MEEEVPGAMGTSASLALRLGQTIFSTASLLFMCMGVEFYSYTAFWGLEARKLMLSSSVVRISRTLLGNASEFEWMLFTYIGALMSITLTKIPSFLVGSLLIMILCSFLVTVMGLVIPWSVTLVLVDAYSVFVKCLPHQPRIFLAITLGDWVLSFLSLAAASSTASVTDLLLDVGSTFCPAKLCSRYQLSAAMAFLSWFLSFASALFNLWLFPSL